MKTILFDLDGTLTESGIGITRSAAYALDQLGIPHPAPEELSVFVGPPLRKTFPEFGVKEEDVDQAIQIFRSRYTTIGKFENQPYEGIEQMLKDLKENGFHLFVATSKPENIAKEILEHFHLSQYFEEIAGASLDASRENKSAVIAYLLEKQDVKEHAIPCIGVNWGYGNKQSMIEAGAVTVVDTVEQLEEYLKKNA